VPSPRTPLLIPTDHPPATGHPSHLPTASHLAHGVLVPQPVAGRLSSLAPLGSAWAVAVGDQTPVVHSEADLAGGEALAHGLREALGLLVLGLPGGTMATAPPPPGQAGPAVHGARLPHGLPGLAAPQLSPPPASSPPPPTVLHTPPLASDTSLRRSQAQDRALRRRRLTTRTVSPLQVVRRLLLSWVSLPCYRRIDRVRETFQDVHQIRSLLNTPLQGLAIKIEHLSATLFQDGVLG
jgi:hypothetical protein